MLLFLGTGAGPGVPAHYCGCSACEEAVADARLGRTRCAALVRHSSATTLVDAPPDLRQQLVREDVEDIDHVVLTHAHYDHTGGLGELEFYVRIKRETALPAYATRATWQRLEAAWEGLAEWLTPHQLDPGQRVELDGVGYTPLEVTHAEGTVGLLLETATGKRTAYIPDTGPLPADTMARIHGVDTLVLGAPFWGRNPMPEDHLAADEAVAIAREAAARELYLTHVSMHYDTPVTCRELEAYLSSRGDDLHLAYDGLRLRI